MKDFVKKIKQEDARIALKKQKLEKMAKARAAVAVNTPSVIIVSSNSTQAETPAVRTESSSVPPPVPRPMPVTVSPLHPSLPPKPGTPLKVATVQDSSKLVAPTPNSIAPLPTNPTPARVSTPVPPPLASVDPEVAKYEEVILLFATMRSHELKIFICRISNGGRGWPLGLLVTNTYNTLGK